MLLSLVFQLVKNGKSICFCLKVAGDSVHELCQAHGDLQFPWIWLAAARQN